MFRKKLRVNFWFLQKLRANFYVELDELIGKVEDYINIVSNDRNEISKSDMVCISFMIDKEITNSANEEILLLLAKHAVEIIQKAFWSSLNINFYEKNLSCYRDELELDDYVIQCQEVQVYKLTKVVEVEFEILTPIKPSVTFFVEMKKPFYELWMSEKENDHKKT